MSTELREKLSEAQGIIREQQEAIERLIRPPHMHCSVIQEKDGVVTLMAGGNYLDIASHPAHPVKPGETVLVSQDTHALIKKTATLTLGKVSTVLRALPNARAELMSDGRAHIAVCAPNLPTLNDGDQVVMDFTGNVILDILPKEKQRYSVDKDTGVNWDDIGGQHEAKKQMIEAVELPLKQAALFKHYGKRPTKGILLFGPPGCGKTMLGKAAATALAQAMGADTSAAGFMYIKGPELLDSYVGATEAAIRALFRRAREYKAEHGVPAVLFIDEADSLLQRRGDRNNFMSNTVVPQFLTEMDGMEESGALVILATNRPDTLDAAITRDGRIDRKVRVSRPTQDETKIIAELYLKKVPLAASSTMKECVDDLTHALFNPRLTFYNLTLESGETLTFALSNLVSGAMIAGLVDQAVSNAMQRDMASGHKTPSGVTAADLLTAVRDVYTQNKDIDHRDALEEFANDRKIKDIQRKYNA